ncbi:MAG: haloacid dehalogenase, partial [Burkholderiaceae bacterium]
MRRLSAEPRAKDASSRLWLIDLDNTLHDASHRIMAEINQRMTHYVAEQLGVDLAAASAVREQYWRRYGATLLGLVRHHGVGPQDFLAKTHPAA